MQNYLMVGAFLVLGALLAVGCVKKLDGETPEAFKARKKAIYSAQVVTGIGGLTDLTEIFVESKVSENGTGRTLIDINDRALGAADVLRERLKTGFAPDKLQLVRDTIGDIEKARKAGVISFKSEKAANFYFDLVATVEVTLNLIEAMQNGTREPSARSVAKQAADRLRAGSDEPKWWNRAIVKATEIARIVGDQAGMDTATAYADAETRSAALHAKHKTLLDSWKS